MRLSTTGPLFAGTYWGFPLNSRSAISNRELRAVVPRVQSNCHVTFQGSVGFLRLELIGGFWLMANVRGFQSPPGRWKMDSRISAYTTMVKILALLAGMRPDQKVEMVSV